MAKKTATKPISAPSLDDGSDRPEWCEGYVWDKTAADRPVQFIEKFCRAPSQDGGPAKPMRLIEWQRERVIRPIFGWKRPDDRLRYRRAGIFCPKKSGKSFLMASLAQYMLCAHFPISDVYVAAVDRLQAREIYRVVAKFVQASPQLSKLLEVIDSRSIIRNREHKNVLRCLSADAYRNEGLNGSVIVDEIHAHRSDELISALTYATRATPNGLVLAISTAGDDRNGVGFQWWKDCELVIRSPSANPSFYGLIYAADPETDDFSDPAVWRKANPSMGITFREEEFRADYEDACTDPRKMAKWLRYSLNVWTESDNRFFHGDAFTRLRVPALDIPAGTPCWCGLDLASNRDITAAVFLFRRPDGGFDLVLKCWVPEQTVAEAERKTKIPYTTWIRDGWMNVTEGARLDHEKVAADIVEFSKRYPIRQIGADPWNLGGIATLFHRAGIEVTEIGQGIGYLTGPTKLLEGLVADRKIAYDSPVMDFFANNVCVRQDANGNIAPDKAKSREKIDGIAATVNALAIAMTAEAEMPADSWNIVVL